MNTESASQRGCNPYNSGIAMGDTTSASTVNPYDSRAKGLDGDMLDAMCKGRWQEGHEIGYEDGHAAARQRFPGIYDDAFAHGHATGGKEAGVELSSQLLPLLQDSGAAFADVAGKTGSEEIKDTCNRMIERLRAVLDQRVGEHAEPVSGNAVFTGPHGEVQGTV